MAERHVTCDVCKEPLDHHYRKQQRRKCRRRYCQKRLCQACYVGTGGEIGYCPECLERRFLNRIEPHERRTSREQIPIWFHGHRIYGIPWIGSNIQYLD